MVFATIISRVFEPIILFISLLIIIFFKAHLPIPILLWQSFIIICIMLALPVALLLHALKTKKISNWDISNRKQRVGALAVFLGIFAFGIFLLSLFHVSIVTNFFLYLLAVLLGFFAVTLFYKMSGHLTVATLWVFCISSWFGWYANLSFVVLPFLCWSRVRLKRHTVSQVLLGMLYGLVVAFIGLNAGYIPK